MPTLLRLITTTLLFSALLSFNACSKKSDQASSAKDLQRQQLSSDPLLNKLPNTTAAFAVLDFGGEGFKLFSKSPYSSLTDAKKSLDKAIEAGRGDEIAADKAALLKVIYDALVKLGMISAEGKYTLDKTISRMALFIGPAETPGTLPIDAGLHIRGAQGVDLSENLKKLRDELVQSKTEIKEEELGKGVLAFSTPFKALNDGKTQIYFAANKTHLALALSKQGVSALFSESDTTTFANIKTQDEYKQATSALKDTPNPLAFTYTSLARLRPLLEPLTKLDKTGGFNPADLPITALATLSSYPKQYIHDLGFAFSPRTESQKKVASLLEKSELPAQSKLYPVDTAVAIMLNTELISKLEGVDAALSQNNDPELTQELNNVKSFTLGVRNKTAGSPIPDIFALLNSADRAKTITYLESSLSSALSLAGQNPTWQKKEIDGTQVNFFTTLLGIGAYIGAPNDSKTVTLGTSESIVKDLLASQSMKTKPANDVVSEPLGAQIKGANVAAFYFNFAKLADVLTSVKDTVGALTGGNAEIDALLNSANIRSWGFAAAGISYQPGVLSVRSGFDPAIEARP